MWAEALFDAALLIVLLAPTLYFFSFRPLIVHLNRRKRAEEALKKAHMMMEARVKERTAGLAKANEALRASEERLSSIVQSANDAIILSSGGGKIMGWNKGAQKIFGYAESEVLGKPLTMLMPERYREAYERGIARVHRTGETRIVGKTVELHGLRKDGSEFPIEFSVAAWKIGGETFYSGIIRDVTERKRAEEALRSGEARNRAFLNAIPDLLFLIRKDGTFIDFKAGKELELLVQPSEFLGKTIYEVSPAEVAQQTMRNVEQALLTGEVQVFEYRLPLKDYIHDYEARVVASGKDEVLMIVRDITERKRIEEALRIYASRLEEANRLKDLFTDVMRHDLLNPAGIVRNFTELLLEEAEGEDRKSLLAIKRNAEKIIAMIEDASMYAKLESTESLEKKKLDLNGILKSAANNLVPMLEEKNMKLEYLAKGECYAMANPIIENVFSNLISNAIKYAPEGKKVEVSIIDEGRSCRICIKDWGEGIPDEDKAKLFTRFTRVDKKGVKGTGLGLAIVKRIVDLHKGKVWIEDNPEGGSVFCVEIPKE